MSKRMTRVLSLILTLIMFVSVSTPAFAWGGGDLGSGWDRDIGEDEIRDFVPEEEIVEEDEPLDYFQTNGADGRQVTVEAPMGSLPRLAELRAEMVEIEDVRETVENVMDREVNILIALDISFWMNGIEIEPEEPVRVKISAPELTDKDNLTLVHIPDAADAEKVNLIDEESLSFALGANEIAFQADSFSVYVVVDGDEVKTPTYTYNFVDGAGDPYPFLNTAGQTVTSQIIKNGESLQKVPAPGLYKDNAFVMWVYGDDCGDELKGQEVKFGEPITVEGRESKVFTIKAFYGSVIYVTFWQYARDKDSEEGNIILEKRQVPLVNGEGSIDLSEVSVPAPKTTLKFMGWSKTPGSDDSEANGDVPDSRLLLDNGVVKFKENTDIYPVYYSGTWFVFISASTGSGASYVEPFFLSGDMTTAASAKPAEPTMTGYAFDGWYTAPEDKEDYDDPDTGTAFDFNIATSELDAYKVQDEHDPNYGQILLYGHWKGGNTSYVVAYWYQNVENSKTLTAHADKSYSYGGQTQPITRVGNQDVTTGSTLTPRTEDTSTSKAGVGFHYANYYDDTAGNTTVTAAPDGSTILNVYFDRDLITMRFYKTAGTIEETGGWWSTEYYYAPQNANYGNSSWTKSNNADTYTGLYGQTWSQAGYNHDWPNPGSGYVWVFFNDEYDDPDTRVIYGNQGTGLTVLGQFKLDLNTYDTSKKEIRLIKFPASVYNVEFFLQNPDGSTYPSSASVTAKGTQGATFGFSDKYVGFKIVGYRIYNGRSWPTNFTPVTATTNDDGSHTYSPESVKLSNNMQIRLEREKYQISFLNPKNNNPVIEAKTLAYEAPLSGAKPTAAETAGINLNEAGYVWDGRWYLDQACTTIALFGSNVASELGDAYVSHDASEGTVKINTNEGEKTLKYQILGTMPIKGTKVYAGKEAIYFYIKMDPNGGQLFAGQSTWRWVVYGDTSHITYKNITRDYIDYKGSGDKYLYYYDEFDTSERQRIWDGNYMGPNQRTAMYLKEPADVSHMSARNSSTATYDGSAWLGTKEFSKEDDAYKLIGWYDVTDPDNEKPFLDNTAITRDTVLQAKWRRTGEYHVAYSVEAVDKNGEALKKDGARVSGANSPRDTAKYADQSDSAIMDKMGVLPTGYNFVGWYYNGKVYQPGDVFQVLASLADNEKTVHIYPVLEPVETLPVKTIDLTYYPNGGEFTGAEAKINALIEQLKTDEGTSEDVTYAPELVKNEDGSYTIKNLKLNESFAILNGDDVANGVVVGEGETEKKVLGRGYRLKEWNTQADGKGKSFKLDVTIGVDDAEPFPNELYAIWEEVFYVYHSATGNFVTMAKGDTTDRWALTTEFNKAGEVNKTQYTTYYYGGYAVYAAGNADAPGLTFSDGSVSFEKDDILEDYWTRVRAAKKADLWNSSDTGAVYYLKEVPTYYLAAPKFVTIRKTYGTGDLTALYFLTDTDTSIYREGGVVIDGNNTKGVFTQSLVLTLATDSSVKTTITAQSAYTRDGYLAVVNLDVNGAAVQYENTKGYWKTYDGVVVYAIDDNIRPLMDISVKTGG